MNVLGDLIDSHYHTSRTGTIWLEYTEISCHHNYYKNIIINFSENRTVNASYYYIHRSHFVQVVSQSQGRYYFADRSLFFPLHHSRCRSMATDLDKSSKRIILAKSSNHSHDIFHKQFIQRNYIILCTRLCTAHCG